MQNYSTSNHLGYPAGAGTYGTAPLLSADAVKPRRKSLNSVSLFISFAFPIAAFMLILWLLSSKTRYYYPWSCRTAAFSVLCLVIAMGYYVIVSLRRRKATGEGEPTWLIFLFISSLLACMVAACLGSTTYDDYMQPYYRLQGMGTYTSVDPRTSSGQLLMDAGRVVFTNTSHLDVSKAMGYKGLQMYCVAPITMNNATLATYDFWAVGMDCCSVGGPGFHCGDIHNAKAHAGLRYMGEGERSFFRLAIKQAESAYKITANHPIFVTWAEDPIGDIDRLFDDGKLMLHNSILGYIVFQLIVVVCAALSFNGYK